MTTRTKCHGWDGTLRAEDGRAMTTDGRYAYRVTWEAQHGPLPEGMVLHHLCGNPACVRLSHLAAMSQSDHMRAHRRGGDWGQADKTHCPQGHPYDEANTYTYRRNNGTTERHCKVCRREARRRFRDRIS